MNYTVEKIGGTSMSAFDTVLDNIILRPSLRENLYNRVFVVSAYGGFTDALLECKRSDKPGVYQLIVQNEDAWIDALDAVEQRMLLVNDNMFADPMDRMPVDEFIQSRVAEAKTCISNILEACQFGQFSLSDYLPQIRESLASLGEVHSAYNTSIKLKRLGVNAKFVDLSGWNSAKLPDTIDDTIRQAFESIDVSRELPIVTGYAASKEGVMSQFDRGYSEMTFSRVASVTNADLAIIHKEYHFSSADPRLVGADKVQPIGNTNYDVADQLANLGMEAIHPNAATGLRESGIELQIKNTFEPEHAGTLISDNYHPKEKCVEIIAGKEKVFAIHLFDQDMACQLDNASLEFIQIITNSDVNLISKEMNANSMTYYLTGDTESIDGVLDRVQQHFPTATIKVQVVSVISAIGSLLDTNQALARGTNALIEEGIDPVALQSSMRNVSVQYVVEEDKYKQAICILHDALCNDNSTHVMLNVA
ncbi:aspartate kinase [Vibrio sp. MA40-2]|uniref:aspartate kinase n=1 Tax=Vibrio sp. MA40-2 TaxID=3391828 RepID=UPI0039A4EA2A